MARALTIDLLDTLNEKLGKEEARKLAEAIEETFEAIDKKIETSTLQRKLELRDELTRELASKADLLAVEARLEGKINTLRQEMQTLRQEMLTIKTELEGKIARLEQKFNFLIVLNIIALTLMNPVAAEIIKRLLKL